MDVSAFFKTVLIFIFTGLIIGFMTLMAHLAINVSPWFYLGFSPLPIAFFYCQYQVEKIHNEMRRRSDRISKR